MLKSRDTLRLKKTLLVLRQGLGVREGNAKPTNPNYHCTTEFLHTQNYIVMVDVVLIFTKQFMSISGSR